MNIEKFKFDVNEYSMAEWITQFAAVSRGKDKSNNPEKRLKALLKEGAGKQPSRPLELMPVMVHVNNLTEEQKKELFKFGHVKGNVLHTNLRAVIKAGVYEDDYIPSDMPFYVYRVTVKKKVWCNLVTKPIATIISNSARVIDLKDNDICTEEVSVIIGGYEKDIIAQLDMYENIIDTIVDAEIAKSLCDVVDGIKSDFDTDDSILNRSLLPQDIFTCKGGGTFIMADPNEAYCKVTEKNIVVPITYNEVRALNNGLSIEDDECIKIEFKLPLFVIYHLYTHTELSVSGARATNEIWFPKDMSNEDKLKVIDFINRKEYSLAREYMKSLGYKKEIYNRYHEFALMSFITLTGRKNNKNGFKHLLFERNVIDPSPSNWTQKETTEYLKLMISSEEKRKLILQ